MFKKQGKMEKNPCSFILILEKPPTGPPTSRGGGWGGFLGKKGYRGAGIKDCFGPQSGFGLFGGNKESQTVRSRNFCIL